MCEREFYGVVDRLFLRLHDVENTGPFLEPSLFCYQCVKSQLLHLAHVFGYHGNKPNTAIETVKYM